MLHSRRRDPMEEALRRGNIGKFARMLKHEPAVVHALNSSGMRALHVTVRMQHTEAVALLLKHGALVNALDTSGYGAALFFI